MWVLAVSGGGCGVAGVDVLCTDVHTYFARTCRVTVGAPTNFQQDTPNYLNDFVTYGSNDCECGAEKTTEGAIDCIFDLEVKRLRECKSHPYVVHATRAGAAHAVHNAGRPAVSACGHVSHRDVFL